MKHSSAILEKRNAELLAASHLIVQQDMRIRDLSERLDKRDTAKNYPVSLDHILDLIGIAREMEREEFAIARHRLEQWLDETEPRWRSMIAP